MVEARMYRAIGVISGTSMDGIDVSAIETDGEERLKPGPGQTYAYPAGLRAELQKVVSDPELGMKAPLVELEAAVTQAHLGAIQTFLADEGIAVESVDLIGLHGQTVYHRPEKRFTRQLISGAAIAKALGVQTVDRMRYADVAAGGEGAPLAPLYHRALAHALPKPLMVLNLGGVGNVTYIDATHTIAFDTGPASAILDDFVHRRRGLAFDRDGALAASGRVDPDILRQLMANPFFDRPPPKSLDRNDFHTRAAIVERLSDADGAATLAAFTIESVADSLRHVPAKPRRWLVTGGGRLNAHFMHALAARLKVPVAPVEAVGWNGDFIEAQAFAYLAVRSLRGLPLSLPSTTGVPRPLPGGILHRP
jgi:anhydro-N-acetylmuramic acid kinase